MASALRAGASPPPSRKTTAAGHPGIAAAPTARARPAERACAHPGV